MSGLRDLDERAAEWVTDMRDRLCPSQPPLQQVAVDAGELRRSDTTLDLFEERPEGCGNPPVLGHSEKAILACELSLPVFFFDSVSLSWL